MKTALINKLYPQLWVYLFPLFSVAQCAWLQAQKGNEMGARVKNKFLCIIGKSGVPYFYDCCNRLLEALSNFLIQHE